MYKFSICSMGNSIHSSLAARKIVREMAAGSFFRILLVTSLVFSHLICMNAVPVTRTESLMHEYQVHQLPENSHPVSAEKVKNISGRMIVELNDYPGSGANNRHTPRAQPGRSGCVDC